MKNNLKSKIKKIGIIIGIIVILFLVLFIYLKFIKKKNEISFDNLIDISKQGENLDWDSFKRYEFEENQDALIYRTYDVEGDYSLVISGKTLDKTPWAFTLKNLKNNKSIDIISEDIIEFLGNDY